MIITCPNCQTRYQVGANTIGSVGRKVLCASCNRSWQAHAEQEADRIKKPQLVDVNSKFEAQDYDDKLFNDADEAALDDKFAKEEQTIKEEEIEPKAEEKVIKRRSEDKKTKKVEENENSDFAKSKRQKDMQHRHKTKAKNLPLSRIKHNTQYFMMFILLSVILGGFVFKNNIVRIIPQMAVLYELVGIDVNIFGLEFNDVKTTRSINDAQEKMSITAKISNITNEPIKVPVIIVTILGANNEKLLQWGATPSVQMIGRGETIEFKTQVNSAPFGSTSVSLSFAEKWSN